MIISLHIFKKKIKQIREEEDGRIAYKHERIIRKKEEKEIKKKKNLRREQLHGQKF